MSDVIFNSFKRKVVDHSIAGTINLLTDTLKCLLVSSSYTGDASDDFVDDGTANDPASHEIAVTNYTAGFAGTGRKTLAGVTLTTDDVNDVVVLDANDVVWTSLGAGATIGAILVYKNGTSDSDSQLIAKFDITNQATNGTNVTAQWATGGLINW